MPSTRVLSCKAKVFMEHRPWTRLFVLRFRFDIGILRENLEKNGQSALSVRMLLEGTKRQDHADLARAFESLGIDYQFAGDGWQFTCLRDQQDSLIDLVCELIRFPNLNSDRFNKLRVQAISELHSHLEDADSLAFYLNRRILCRSTPGELIPGGTPGSLRNLEVKDCQDFQDSFFLGSGLQFYVAGNFDKTRLIDGLERGLSSLKPGRVKPPEIQIQDYRKQKGAYCVVRDRHRFAVVMGHSGAVKWCEGFSVLKVLDQILGLGSGFTSRLSRRLREELGLCYQISGDLTTSASRIPGLFQVQIGTGPETVVQAMQEISKTLEKFLLEGPEEEEIEDTRRYMAGGFAFQLETNTALVNLMIEKELYHLEPDFLIREQAEFASVTRQQIHEAARTWLHPDQLLSVVVGPDSLEGFQSLSLEDEGLAPEVANENC
jgi:zinc protease